VFPSPNKLFLLLLFINYSHFVETFPKSCLKNIIIQSFSYLLLQCCSRSIIFQDDQNIRDKLCFVWKWQKKASLVLANKEMKLVLGARLTLAYLSTCYLQYCKGRKREAETVCRYGTPILMTRPCGRGGGGRG
jgi:hypothetical protein